MHAVLAAKALGRLSGVMFDELASPAVPSLQRALAQLLTQPLAKLLRNRRPWDLLLALNQNVEKTTMIWNVSMRQELLDFVLRVDRTRAPGSNEMVEQTLLHNLKTHPINTFYPYQQAINTPYQSTLSTHPINPPCQRTLSRHPTNKLATFHQHTLSTPTYIILTHCDAVLLTSLPSSLPQSPPSLTSSLPLSPPLPPFPPPPRTPLPLPQDLLPADRFQFSALKGELCIGGVYVRIFNRTGATVDIDDPSEFAKALLLYIQQVILLHYTLPTNQPTNQPIISYCLTYNHNNHNHNNNHHNNNRRHWIARKLPKNPIPTLQIHGGWRLLEGVEVEVGV